MSNNAILKRTFFISLAGHFFLLSSSLFNIDLVCSKPPEDIEVKFKIEKPQLLPKIDKLSDEKKIKEIEQELVEASPEPEHKQERAKRDSILESKKTIVERDVPKPTPVKEKIKVTNPDKEAMFRYRDMIKREIQEARKYTRWAEEHDMEGVSYLVFTLLSNGIVQNIKIVHSSGFDILDKEAISTVKRASPFKPIPDKFNCSSLSMEVALVFQLKY